MAHSGAKIFIQIPIVELWEDCKCPTHGHGTRSKFCFCDYWNTESSHTLNAICLPHDNATALYWHFYQHHNHNRIGVNNRKKLSKRWYTSINFRQEFAKGWEGVKTVALSGKKEKLNHVTKRETDILTRTQVPHSVWENFVSCLFRKLSWQEKHLIP